MRSKAASGDAVEHVLRQAARHKDVLIRRWARKMLAGDAKKPRRRKKPQAAAR
jgi:hypothetical protein